MISTKKLILTMALAFSLGNLAAPAFAAETASHEQHATTINALELNAGQKWTTDAPLQKGMNTIYAAVSKALPAAHEGKLTPTEYDAFSKEIDTQFTYIVENCKLEPQADAQLHILLGQMVGGLETVKGKEPGQDRALGVVKIAEAANAYGEHFDHPGWKKIELPH